MRGPLRLGLGLLLVVIGVACIINGNMHPPPLLAIPPGVRYFDLDAQRFILQPTVPAEVGPMKEREVIPAVEVAPGRYKFFLDADPGAAMWPVAFEEGRGVQMQFDSHGREQPQRPLGADCDGWPTEPFPLSALTVLGGVATILGALLAGGGLPRRRREAE
jgi:hypothetical protein